jgi:DNA adenine methylase
VKAPKPFLRWAGGKRRLAPALIEAFPKDFDPIHHKFIEPFIGGGALTFALGDPEAQVFVPGRKLIVNDLNPELVNAYTVLRDQPTRLKTALDDLKKSVNSERFYEIRGYIPKSTIQRAARFIYLNKTCYNGLWRVNSSGEFNVPFDKSSSNNLYDESNLYSCSARLQGAKITNLDYLEVTKSAKKGDFVYFDPPYIPRSSGESFAAYAKEGFGIENQLELAHEIQRLTSIGVHVLLSNSDTPLTREIFGKHLTLRRLLMRRTISADGKSRKPVFEILGMNYEHLHGNQMKNMDLVSKPFNS